MLTVEQFLRNVAKSGLMSSDEAQALRDSPEAAVPDGRAFAKKLVWRGVLTSFQAAALCEPVPRRLRLGSYVLLNKLGGGGMGQVYQARHTQMGSLRALKVLPKRLIGSPDAVRRFRREIETTALLDHPNIVAALDAGEERGVFFLVMEYVPGRNLLELVKERGPRSWAEALDYTLQAARGLEYAHRQGVVHRDVKPSNLLLSWQGVVKVLDLGLARIADLGDESHKTTLAALTLAGHILGTVDYMALEQVMDTHRADGRADIYSLGCTLHFLLTGRPPYSGDGLAQRIAAHFKQPIPNLQASRPDIPVTAQIAFRGMMRKHAENRFQTMTEVATALEGLR